MLKKKLTKRFKSLLYKKSSAFYANRKRSPNASTKKDGCQIASTNLLVDQLFASTKLIASPWAGLTKQLYKQFPKRTVICTSSLQVFIVNFTSEITSAFIGDCTSVVVFL